MYRLLDTNVNRVSEGLRVIEDLMRFKFNNFKYSKALKDLRHCVRDNLKCIDFKLLENRDVDNDYGIEIDESLSLDKSLNLESILIGNFKRVQEGLRTLEEITSLESLQQESDNYKKLRYESYGLEKQILSYINRSSLSLPDLYGITYLKDSNGRSNIEVVKEMIAAGIKLIQYREKDLPLAEKFKECLQIRELTRESGVTFIVNDNIDIAILVDADGVHIGQDDLPIKEVRRLLGINKIVGISTHSPIQAKKALLDGADYIGVGPIFATKTKVNVCDPVGIDYLKWVKNNIDIPFVTIGGIKEHNLKQVVRNGADCIALVSEITSSNSIKNRVIKIREKIKEIKNGI